MRHVEGQIVRIGDQDSSNVSFLRSANNTTPIMKQSIWAQSNENSNSSSRLGNWNCPSCGFSNFQRRSDCMQCSRSKTGQQNFTAPTAIHGNIASSWKQSKSRVSLPPIADVFQQSTLPSSSNSLADSHWAPRNFKGRVRQADTSQVWIRKPSQEYVHAQSKISEHTSNSKPASPPDLGLPYEVQHFILAMIQRILEEGCYDFAYRWIPGALLERNWSCPEAVELSAWRDFLPNALPPNAIAVIPGRSLYQGLRDAVKIRNAAVHRHLCDNFEIRKMAQQAQDLMTMLRDVTRQSKFNRLRIELNDWNRSNKIDPQSAKWKLEQVLQEINERPMDDMDWTPNAVSLQEITLKVEQTHDAADYGDAMEID